MERVEEPRPHAGATRPACRSDLDEDTGSLNECHQLANDWPHGDVPAVANTDHGSPAVTHANSHAQAAHPNPNPKPACPYSAVNGNPWCYNFSCCNTISSPPANFCRYFPCIANFWNGKGSVEECQDQNQHRGHRTVQQGAIALVRPATLPADGPAGGFFDENGIAPW